MNLEIIGYIFLTIIGSVGILAYAAVALAAVTLILVFIKIIIKMLRGNK